MQESPTANSIFFRLDSVRAACSVTQRQACHGGALLIGGGGLEGAKAPSWWVIDVCDQGGKVSSSFFSSALLMSDMFLAFVVV